MQFGAGFVVNTWVMPYVFFVIWLDAVTYLHHTDRELPWCENSAFDSCSTGVSCGSGMLYQPFRTFAAECVECLHALQNVSRFFLVWECFFFSSDKYLVESHDRLFVSCWGTLSSINLLYCDSAHVIVRVHVCEECCDASVVPCVVDSHFIVSLFAAQQICLLLLVRFQCFNCLSCSFVAQR